MCERPCLTAQELKSADSLREELLALWSRPDLRNEDRLFVISALSGCARPEDVLALIVWMDSARADSEEARLTCAAVTRILLRLACSGDLAGIDFPGIWGALGRRMTPLLEYGAVCYWDRAWKYSELSPYEIGLLDLTLRVSDAEVRAGRPSLVHTIAPESWWPVLEQGGRAAFERLQWISGSADPRVRRAMLNLEQLELWHDRPNSSADYLGIWAGLSMDHEFTAQLRRLSGHWAGPNVDLGLNRACFDQRLYLVAAAQESAELNTNLDPPTMLGAPQKDPGWVEWDLQEAAEVDAKTLASWEFNRPLPTRGGTATKARTKDFEVESDSYGRYLVGRKLDRSEIQLHYEGQPPAGISTARLALQHVSARRSEFPYRGEVYLQIRVDDHLVADGLLVTNGESKDPNFETIDLPGQFLDSGDHVLSIRLDPRSTTTYRLLAANLRFQTISR